MASWKSFTYRELLYWQRLVDQILIDDIEVSLIRLNFNHLLFVEEVRHRAAELKFLSCDSVWAYQPDWPSVTHMLADAAKQHWSDKLPLDLSVAQLACYTKAAQAAGWYGNLPLQSLFKHICGNYRTKRQDDISERSFAKEFYGISQITAARVRAQLLEMVAWINRSFFPE